MLGLGIKDYAALVVSALLVGYIAVLKFDAGVLKAENKELNGRIIAIEAVSKQAQKEAEVRVVEVVKEVEVVKKETEYKIKKIREYVRDENKSDCASAMDFARSYF